MVMMPAGVQSSPAMFGLQYGQNQLTGKEAQAYELQRSLTNLREPRVLTAEEAQLLGIDLSQPTTDSTGAEVAAPDDWADYLVRLTPNRATQSGFDISVISPDDDMGRHYEFMQDGSVLTPEGKSYTAEEWAQLSTTGTTDGRTNQYGTVVSAPDMGNSVQLLTGEYVSLEQYNPLSYEEKTYLGTYGIDAFNAWNDANIQTAISNRAELTSLWYQAVNAPLPDFQVMTPGGTDRASRFMTLTQSDWWKQVTQAKPEEIPDKLIAWQQADPQGFVEAMTLLGRNAKTEALVRNLYPTIDEETLAGIFGEPGPSGWTFPISMSDGTEMPARLMPDQTVHIEYAGEDVSIGTFDVKTQVFTPDLEELGFIQRQQDIEKAATYGILERVSRKVEAGFGHMMTGVAGFLDSLTEGATPEEAKTYGYMSGFVLPMAIASQFLHNEGGKWESHGVGIEGMPYQIVEQLPMTVSLGVAAYFTGGAVAGVVGSAAGAAGVSTGMGAFASEVSLVLGSAVSNKAMEAALEAGGAYNQAIAQGMTESEASDVANQVFNRNVRDLTALDIVEWAAFYGLGKSVNFMRLQQLGVLVAKTPRVVRIGGKVALTAFTEGGEEYYQEIITRQELGEDIDTWALQHNLSQDDIRQIVFIGAIMGAGFGTVGEVVQTIDQNVVPNLSPEMQQAFNAKKAELVRQGMPVKQADLEAKNWLATQASGKETIAQVGKAAQMQARLKAVNAKSEADTRRIISKAEGVAPPVTGIEYRLANEGTENLNVNQGGKEPWQMTREDYTDVKMEELRDSKMYHNSPRKYQQQLEQQEQRGAEDEWLDANERAFIEGKSVQWKPSWALTVEEVAARSDDSVDDYLRASHKNEVAKALSEGKPVPAEVLAEYPDLAGKAKPAAEPTPAAQPAAETPPKPAKKPSKAKAPKSAEALELAAEAEQAPPLPEPKPKDKLASLRERYQTAISEVREQASERVAKVRKQGKQKLSARQQADADRLQAAKDKAKTRAEEIASIKNDLRTYVEEHLPMSERGHMIAAIDKITTEAQLGVELGRVEVLAEKYARNSLLKRIDKAVDISMKPSKMGGTYDADLKTQITKIKANLRGDYNAAQAQIITNMNAFQNGTIEYEAMLDANTLLSLQGVEQMDSAQLQSVLSTIKYLKQEGKLRRSAAQEAHRAKIEGLRTMAGRVLTGGEAQTAISPAGKFEPKRESWMTKGIHRMVGWSNFLDELSVKDTSHQHDSDLSKWGNNRQHEAWVKETRGVTTHMAQIIDEMKAAIGVDTNAKVNKWINGLYEEVEVGTFKDADGNEVTLKGTRNELLKKYMQLQDPTLQRTFDDGMKWTPEIREAVTNALTPQERAVANTLLNFYADYWSGINEVYRAYYGVDLGHIEGYSGRASRAGESFDVVDPSNPEHLRLLEDQRIYASERNASLKERTGSIKPLKWDGAVETLVNHVIQMEHFKAYTPVMTELRGVFGNAGVRQTIQANHGADILRAVDRYLNDFARGSIEHSSTAHLYDNVLNTLRRNFMRSVIVLKPAIILQQIPQNFAALTRTDLATFASGTADFWRHPFDNMAFMMERSVWLKDRWEAGGDRDLRTLLRQTPKDVLTSTHKVIDWLAIGFRGGDALGVIQSMWVFYQEGLSMNLTEEQAIQRAELLCMDIQPSAQIAALSELERGGPFVKLMTMFQSQPNRYFRIVNDNIRNLQAGRISKMEAMKNLSVAWFVLPAIFGMIAGGLRWKNERNLPDILLSPVNSLLIIGPWLQQLEGWLFRKEPWDIEATPVLSSLEEFHYAISNARKLIMQGMNGEEISMSTLVTFCEHFAKGVGELTGIPTPYLVQVEKAIRAGDPRQIVWSPSALGATGTTKKAPDANSISKSVREKEKSLVGAQGNAEAAWAVYSMKGLANEYEDLMGKLDPEQITGEGFSPLAQNWGKMEWEKAWMATMPDKPLYELNADRSGTEETYDMLWALWEARMNITNPEDLKKFNDTYSDTDVFNGNFNKRKLDLLQQYHALTNDADRAEFLRFHPEIAHNPREEYLRGNPEANALLALWGQEECLTKKAYDRMMAMAEELDIPESIMLNVIPANMVDAYFEYKEAVYLFGKNSDQVKLFRLEHPEVNDYLDLGDVGKTAGELELDVKWTLQDQTYESLNARSEWEGLAYLMENPEYATARFMRDAYHEGYPEDWVDDYAQYQTGVELNGQNKYAYMAQHPDFFEVAYEVDRKVRGWGENITQEWLEYHACDTAKQKTAYLSGHREYATQLYTEAAGEKEIPDEWVDEYVAFRIATDLDGMANKMYLKGHQDFYEAVKDIMGWDYDFSTVSTLNQRETEGMTYADIARQAGYAEQWISAYVQFRTALDAGYTKREYLFKHQDLYRYMLSLGEIDEINFTRGPHVRVAGVPLRMSA